MDKEEILFLCSFVLFFTSINTYISYRLEVLLGITFAIVLIVLTGVVILVPVLTSLQKKYMWISPAYILSYFLYGGLIIAASLFVVEHVISFFIYIHPIITLVSVALVILYATINSRVIRVKRVSHKLKEVNMRLVHLSDLHIGVVNGKKFLEKVVKKTRNLDPDVVVITGDTLDGGEVPKDVLAPLKKIKVPVIAVLGNHDGYYGWERSEKMLIKAGVKVLRGESIVVKGVEFVGMDCPLHGGSGTDPNPVLKNMKLSSKPKVLLYHMPSGISEARKQKIDVFLAGHTHGGQVFPFTFLVRQKYKYHRGLYSIGKMKLYVSQGTGTWGPPVRFFSYSEMGVWDF